jgi:toxin ParE1/3/4
VKFPGILLSVPNKYQVKITAPAFSDIEDIAAYTFEKWGAQQADIHVSRIDRTIQAIADSPTLGRERIGVPTAIKGRKSGAHVVFYRVQDTTIYIMRILHESMDHGRHIEADA